MSRADDLGAVLVHYASGDGSLSFVWQYRYSTKAHPEKVDLFDVVDYMKANKDFFEGWCLLDRYGIPKAFRPVERVDSETVRIGAGVPRYYRYEKAGHILRVFDDESEIKNQNIISQIDFFLSNEELLNESPIYRI